MGETDASKTPVLEDPRRRVGRNENGPRWSDQVKRAMEARRLGARLREGKPKSFRPVVGRI